MAEGNRNVILCERGIRTFETYTRNTLDLSAVLAVKRQSHLPIVVDPSHATGKRWMVADLARAAVAAGAAAGGAGVPRCTHGRSGRGRACTAFSQYLPVPQPGHAPA